MRVDIELIELAQRQHHLVDRRDVGRLMTPRQWRRRVDDGTWVPVAPDVWCHLATPIDWRLQARAGARSLGRQAALYGRTAAAWWGLGDIAVADVEFLVPRSRRSRVFPFTLHTTDDWRPRELLVRNDVRLTNATRTCIDMADGSASSGEIERVIDASISRRLTTLPVLSRRLKELEGSGRVGGPLLRALLLDSGGESYLERRFLALVRRNHLPRPTCQVVHRVDGKHIARVDFQFPGTNVIVEVSGRLGHVSDRDRQRDARRRNALQASRHIVLEFTTADVLDEQAYVVAALLAELSATGR